MSTAIGITHSNLVYSTPYDGWLGLAPPTSKADKNNFLVNLMSDEIITYRTVSFYFSGQNSFLKFGGYDKGAIHPKTSLLTYRTRNSNTWDVNIKNCMFGSNSLTKGKDRIMKISTQLPYLYIPKYDFLAFVSKFNG